MSYTPHTWVDNETITAAKLNNIEDGVQEAAQSGGGGGLDAVIWFPNSSKGYQVSGDFNSALAKVQQGIPLVAAYFESGEEYSYGFTYWVPHLLSCEYFDSNPNTIFLMKDSISGFRWTSSGIEHYYND